MDDLISRERAIKEAYPICIDGDVFEVVQVETLIGIPSIDAVQVIRCKDCRWGRKVCGNIECFVDSNVPPEYHGYDWFCPNGERKADG